MYLLYFTFNNINFHYIMKNKLVTAKSVFQLTAIQGIISNINPYQQLKGEMKYKKGEANVITNKNRENNHSHDNIHICMSITSYLIIPNFM